MKKLILIALLLWITAPLGSLFAEEGDFFFAPEFGWSHLFSSSVKDGIYAGTHFGYDTSDHLTLELLMLYGNNTGTSGNPSLRSILGGGGASYKYQYKNLKPSIYAGASVTGLKFEGMPSAFKGGIYFGGALEYYFNKVVSIGISYKFISVVKASDISDLGLRVGLDL